MSTEEAAPETVHLTLFLTRVFTEELTQEPLIFTKDSKAYRPRPTLHEHGEGEKTAPSSSAPLHPPPVVQRQVPQAMRPKTLLSMKQTVVERIADSVERFDYYQRGLKQHLGRRNPFDLYERWERLWFWLALHRHTDLRWWPSLLTRSCLSTVWVCLSACSTVGIWMYCILLTTVSAWLATPLGCSCLVVMPNYTVTLC